MASSPAPRTPEDTSWRKPTIYRSVTAPLATPTKVIYSDAEIASSEGVETLFHHPNAKLVRFTALPKSGSNTPWESPSERIIDAGGLEIYRVPSPDGRLITFFNCGDTGYPIKPNANCWCVDDVSKFVLRVTPDTYNRIELPAETEEDLVEVEKFKDTLRKVCHYERLPCPFARKSNVDAPDAPAIMKKGKRRKSSGPATKWKLDKVWRPEGWVEPEKVSEESASGSASPAGSDDESDGAITPMEQEESLVPVKPVTPTTPMRQRALAALRSASTPQAPTILSTPPSRLRTRVDLDGTIEVTEMIPSASNDRDAPTLRTFQAIPTDMPPSPPNSSAGLESAEDSRHLEVDVADQDARASETVADNHAHHATLQADVTVREHEQHDEGSRQGHDATAEPLVDFAVEHVGESPPQQISAGSAEQSSSKSSAEASATIAIEAPQPQTPQLSNLTDEDPQSEQSLASVDDNDKIMGQKGKISETSHQEGIREDELPVAYDDDRPRTPENQTALDDPYAAIQARILARRSLSGTVSFHPGFKSPTRQSTSSSSSTATISSSKSALSRRSQSSHQQQAFSSAMVKKAYNTFLGPPAHLVAIMLKIAARFANGAFGVESMFYVESPIDSPRKVPGSYHLVGGNVQKVESDFEDEEDDFGVPLRSPVRIKSRSESSEGVRERKRWDVD